jgi:hypothetical protein
MMLAAGDDAAMFVVGMGAIIVFTWIIANQWRRTREAAYNARLKQMMIERGMSAAEIERVIKVGGRARGKISECCVPEAHNR